MTQARHLTVAEGQQAFYHCVTRCVRRAWLCGIDPITKVDYEHRKPMIASRIVQLAGIFAVDVYSYAVMSNHLHVVGESNHTGFLAPRASGRVGCALKSFSRNVALRPQGPLDGS